MPDNPPRSIETINPLQNVEETLRLESVRKVVLLGIKAHIDAIKAHTEDLADEDQAVGIADSEIASLKTLGMLIGNGSRQYEAYLLKQSRNGTRIYELAARHDIRGSRLRIDDSNPPTESTPIRRLKVVKEPVTSNPYTDTPEEIVVNRPIYRISIAEEDVFVDFSVERLRYHRLTGISFDVFADGHMEVFGTKGVGTLPYSTTQPILVLESEDAGVAAAAFESL